MARSVNARELATKREVAAELARHGSGYVLVAAIAGGLALRRRGPRPGRGDAAAVLTVVALQPLIEWGLHRYLLHLPARTVAGRRFDPGSAHRGHHRVPDDVGGALLGTSFAVSNGAVAAAAAAGIGAAVGGPVAVGSAVAAGEAGLLAYEWVHLLSHSGYRGRTRWFRQLRASHLRHHYRDDGTNFGITSRVIDRLLHTAT